LPAPGGLLDMPDVGKAFDEVFGKKRQTNPNGPSRGDLEGPDGDDEPSIMDRLTGNHAKKLKEKEEKKKKLD
jgi:hypothetical protein